MKKLTPRSTRFAPARLDAVTGGTRAQILDVGGTNPPSDQDPDARTQIIDIG